MNSYSECDVLDTSSSLSDNVRDLHVHSQGHDVDVDVDCEEVELVGVDRASSTSADIAHQIRSLASETQHVDTQLSHSM